jgi:glycosyltransferase involved in cell wall biosynthesis
VKDGVTGFLVPSNDPAALASAITRLFSDPSQAKAMGAAGKVFVAENFTTETMMTRITTAYKNLLAHNSPLAAGRAGNLS